MKTGWHAVRVVAAGVVLSALATAVQGQNAPPQEPRFTGPEESFDVTSVKPNRTGATQWDFDSEPGRVYGTNVVLRDLIRFGYFIYGGDWDIRIAAPEWIKTARFDIEGKTAGAVPQARAMSMLRQLLADRFGLKVHYEMRPRPAYALTLARADRRLGPQLTPNPIDCGAYSAAVQAARAGRGTPPPMNPETPTCGSRGEPGHLLGNGLSMQQLALQITGAAGRPIVDETGFGGAGFDVDLHWSPDPAAATGAPSIFTAIEEQLGLKLVPKELPVQVLVIDDVRQPDSN